MFKALFQPMHLLVIAFIALIVFGPKRLPELGKGLGEGIRQFKKSVNDVSEPASEKVSQSASPTDAEKTAAHPEQSQS